MFKHYWEEQKALEVQREELLASLKAFGGDAKLVTPQQVCPGRRVVEVSEEGSFRGGKFPRKFEEGSFRGGKFPRKFPRKFEEGCGSFRGRSVGTGIHHSRTGGRGGAVQCRGVRCTAACATFACRVCGVCVCVCVCVRVCVSACVCLWQVEDMVLQCLSPRVSQRPKLRPSVVVPLPDDFDSIGPNPDA